MNATDYALTSIERLKGMLLIRQGGGTVPQLLIDRELALLTERVRAMGSPEPTTFDLDQFRSKANRLSGEADETPVGASGVAEESDEG